MHKEIEFISGFKFAEMSDVIFSGMFEKSQMDFLNLKHNIRENAGEHLITGRYIFVRTKNFELKENDIIFTKTDFIYELFSILKKQSNFKNIKLITHQSDLRVSKKMYEKKPQCISEWYSCNVDIKREDLIPIPLGLANFHPKNLNENHFLNNINYSNYFGNKEKLLYINFNPNTNFSHRKNIYTSFQGFEWADSDKTPISLDGYKKRMSKYNFVLAPWGNGIDTHRFWEILYSGSIPVTKKHIIYESFKNIPKIQLNNYSQVTKNFLTESIKVLDKNKEKYNFEEIDFKYWKNKIKSNEISTTNLEPVLMQNYWYLYYGFITDFKYRLKSKFKLFNRIRRFAFKKLGI